MGSTGMGQSLALDEFLKMTVGNTLACRQACSSVMIMKIEYKR